MNWVDIKAELVEHIGVSKDALHVLLAVAALLVFAKILRREVSHWLPLSLVVALALTNEWLDILNRGGIDRMNARLWADGIKDLAITFALPLLLSVTVRFLPEIFTRPGRRGDD